MPPLWAGYEFHDSLEFWATEVADAALDVPDAERESFLGAVCDGSERLLGRARALLTHVWREPDRVQRGSCRPGEVVRDCVVLRLVGRGGMGEVYRAIQRPLRRIVALKVLTGDVATLAREATSAALIAHPNIVTVYDADLQGQRPCIVMEFVEGVTLRTWIERQWRERQSPSSSVVRSLARQTALALSAAHRKGLVHCDVKPENILLVKAGTDATVKVTDFGIARRIETPSGPAAGTPGYVAPEQFDGTRPDPRTDIFALGVVLHEMLTGQHPFTGGSIAETYYNTLSTVPALPSTGDPSLAAIAGRAIQKAPALRYQTADQLVADIDKLTDQAAETILNPLLSELPGSVQRWWSRHSAGGMLALISSIWGCLSLAMSVALGTACVRVVWSSSAALDKTSDMLFGYAIEPNAGLWYVGGSSLCLLVGCGFLEAAFRALSRTSALTTVDGSGSDPVARVATRNRTIFRIAAPVILVVAAAFVTVPELAYRRDHAFGWVQADFADEFLGASYDALRDDGKIGELQSVAALCPACPIRVAAVSNGRHGFEAPAPPWFAAFLMLALGHQILLMAFLIWLGAKVLFFFWLLSTALLGGSSHGLRLVPDFGDEDDYRFGLGRLDNVYYTLLVFVIVGSMGLFLQAAANISKGTYFLAGDPIPALFGQAVLLLGTLALLAVSLLTPVGIFLFLSIKAVDEELGRLSSRRRDLDNQLAAARSLEERAHLRDELEAVGRRRRTTRKQSLLPLRQPAFLLLLSGGIFTLLILPLTVQRSRNAAAASHTGASIANAVCDISGNPRQRLR